MIFSSAGAFVTVSYISGVFVDFLTDLAKAAIMVAVPIGLFTYVMVRWALSGSHFKESSSTQGLQKEMKALSKNKKTEPKIENLVHRKWVQFGGGFYGIVAFFTYIVIEVTELVNMILEFGGLMDFIRNIDIGLLVGIFVEAIMNFVAAIIWPLYWMQKIDSQNVWVWFVAAYGGYTLGARLAQAHCETKRDKIES